MKLSAFKEDLFFSFRHPRVRGSIIGFLFSVMLALGIGVLYWWPAMHEVSGLKSEIDYRRREIASAEYNMDLARASGHAAQQVARIEKKLDTSVTQAVLVQNVAALARRNSVKIISEAYEEGKSKDGYSSLVHELTVQAGYAELRGFISGIQQLPVFSVVQEATLSRSPNSSVIKAQLNIITYQRIAEQ